MEASQIGAFGQMHKTRRALIDIEASGLGSQSYPIEIAIVDIDSDFSWTALIKPAPDWRDGEWDEISEEIHGISRDMLNTDGFPAHEVAAKVWEIVKDGIVYTDALEMDGYWLSRLAACATASLEGVKLLPLPAVPDDECSSRVHRALPDALQLKRQVLLSFETPVSERDD